MTLAYAVLVVCTVVLAVLGGRLLMAGARTYGWFVRDHFKQERAPRFGGQCGLTRCNKAAVPGSEYCSDEHDLEDDFINLG